MKKALFFALALAACFAPTDPTRPVISRITPSEDPPAFQFGNLLCVTGRNLTGGDLHFGDRVVPSKPVAGCDLYAAIPYGPPGVYQVYVVTSAGESNRARFTRRQPIPDAR